MAKSKSILLAAIVLPIILLSGCSITEFKVEGQSFDLPDSGLFYSQYYLDRVIIGNDNSQTTWPALNGASVRRNFNYSDKEYNANSARKPVVVQIDYATEKSELLPLKISNFLGWITLSLWPHNCFADREYSVKLLQQGTQTVIADKRFRIHRWHGVQLLCLNYFFTESDARNFLDYNSDLQYEYQVINNAIMQELSQKAYQDAQTQAVPVQQAIPSQQTVPTQQVIPVQPTQNP